MERKEKLLVFKKKKMNEQEEEKNLRLYGFCKLEC